MQFSARPDVIDLGWGHPDPDLLPVDELRRAADEAARRWGPDLYAYGYAQGPAPLLTWLAERLGQTDELDPPLQWHHAARRVVKGRDRVEEARPTASPVEPIEGGSQGVEIRSISVAFDGYHFEGVVPEQLHRDVVRRRLDERHVAGLRRLRDHHVQRVGGPRGDDNR